MLAKFGDSYILLEYTVRLIQIQTNLLIKKDRSINNIEKNM
jgi:hypothetical protein